MDYIVKTALFVVSAWAIFFSVFGIAVAYDSPPVVDPPSTAYSRGIEQPVYRFGPISDDVQTYQDGTQLPTRTFSIEQWNPTTQKWDVIGYANTHLHKVKIDATDKMDISLGSTHRINPKN